MPLSRYIWDSPREGDHNTSGEKVERALRAQRTNYARLCGPRVLLFLLISAQLLLLPCSCPAGTRIEARPRGPEGHEQGRAHGVALAAGVPSRGHALAAGVRRVAGRQIGSQSPWLPPGVEPAEPLSCSLSPRAKVAEGWAFVELFGLKVWGAQGAQRTGPCKSVLRIRLHELRWLDRSGCSQPRAHSEDAVAAQ